MNPKPAYKNAEVWYKIHKDFWGQGYATEAVKELLKFGFESLELHRIEAGCVVENIGSKKALEKAGFLYEGLKRKLLPIRAVWKYGYTFALLEEDYFAKK
jgi:RimJ/RimL family protein N-acetyltransferase